MSADAVAASLKQDAVGGGGDGDNGGGDNRYLAQKAMAALDLFIMDVHWTQNEVLKAIHVFGEDAAWVEQKCDEFNIKLTEDEEWNWNEGVWRTQLCNELRKQMFKKIQRMDVLTQLSIITPYNQAVVAADSYKERSNFFFLKTFFPFGYGTVTGIPGSGKTHMAVNLMVMSLQGDPNIPKPFKVASNIKLEPEKDKPIPEGITDCSKLTEIVLTCIDNTVNHGALTNIILDEIPQTFNRKRATSNNYVNMEKMLLLLRKVGGNFIAVIQRPEDVPSVISSFSHCSFHKTSHEVMIFKRDEETFKVKDVPQTTIKYDTRDIASFQVDLKMDDVHQHIISLPKGTNQLQAIKELIGGQSNAQELTEGQVNTAIRVLHELRGFSFEEISQLFGGKANDFSSKDVWKRYHAVAPKKVAPA